MSLPLRFVFQREPLCLVEKTAVRQVLLLAPDGAVSALVAPPLFAEEPGAAHVPLARLPFGALRQPGSPACPVGTVEFCRAWMNACGVEEPEPLDYPEALRGYLRRRVQRFASPLDVPDGWWVKPVKTKAWEAYRCSTQEPAPLREGPVWCTEHLPVIAEFRAYVLSGQLRSVARYDDGEGPDEPPTSVLNFVQDVLSAYVKSGTAPVAFALDVVLLTDGRAALLEVSDAWALGKYKECLATDYARMLLARWAELCAAPVPLGPAAVTRMARPAD